jgi:hypothetical protein
MSTVTEIIEAVKSLSVEEKEEFLLLLSEVDFDGTRAQDSSLQETMNTISEKAKSRGLTPQILESLLRQK